MGIDCTAYLFIGIDCSYLYKDSEEELDNFVSLLNKKYKTDKNICFGYNCFEYREHLIIFGKYIGSVDCDENSFSQEFLNKSFQEVFDRVKEQNIEFLDVKDIKLIITNGFW